MALSVNYLYEFVLKLIRKNQSGGLSSTEFAYHWNDAQSTYFDDLAGRFQKNNTGKEGPNTGLMMDKTILQKLAIFTKPATLTISAGNSDKPDDFIYHLALTINGFDVIHINHDQKNSVNNSVIDPPNIASNKYYYVEYEDYYSFLPNTVATASLDYIATPTDILWASTRDSENRQIYNEGTSIQPLWDNSSCREITKRMLTNLGVTFKDPDFENFGKSVQNMGE